MQSSIDSLKSAIEKDSNNHILHYKLGRCYSTLENCENALAAYMQALKHKPDFAYASYRIGIIYYSMDSLEKAYEYLRSIENSISTISRFNVYEQLAKICTRLNRHKEAIEYYQRALVYCVDCFEYKMAITLLYYGSGDSLQARKCFEKTIEHIGTIKSMSKTLKLWNSAVYHYYFGLYNQAISLNEQVINLDTTDGIVRYNMGNYRIASGDASGLNNIKAAISKDSTGFVKAVYEALSCILADSFANAEKQLRQNIPGLKRSGLAFGLRAWTLEKLGREGEAKKYWAEAWGKLPLGITVESMRAYINKFIETLKKDQ